MKTIIRPRLITLALVCFALVQNAQAVNPPPDGGYPGGNTAEGQNALLGLTTGTYNTAVGLYSLLSDTTGKFNTGVGAGTLLVNATAEQNTATGAGALFSHTSGNGNTANGTFALFSDTSGQVNTATGASALFNNTSGSFNTANGLSALFSNTTGGDNTANGAQSLLNNITGNDNTAVGLNALANNTSGSNNVALGRNAGIGQTTGSGNVYIGQGIQGFSGESDACYIASIFGQTSSGGIPVLINASHKLGTTTSSQRFKEDIKAMGTASEALFSLKPVTFRYRKDIDPAGTPQLGLVAEHVEKVNSDLVVRDKEGKAYSVRYDQVNAMLLNEFLKEHNTVQELKFNVARQEATIARQQKQIEALAAGLQKVSAQLEMSRAAPQTVLNSQ
jgi:Chaperone of endosialidase